MAIVKIVPIELEEYNKASAEVDTSALTTAIDASAGAYYEHKERDDKYLVIAQNTATSAGVLTVKKGNSIQGVVDNAISIGASKTVCFTLESGMFKNVSGDNKGKVLFAGPATIKLAVIKLP